MDALIKKYTLPAIAAISVIIFLCFSYTVGNQFTNWDDDYYVTNDPYIKALTAENLKVIFTEDITKNNYHPLCMLSLAINYHFSQLNPAPYYITNIVIHIINALLVFFLALSLARRLKVDSLGQIFIACVAGLWFGVHPMHVESVAWIAERKDVLYAFFYFLALMAYLRYMDSSKASWYWLTVLLFVASCLSKPMAVVLPLSLLCLDVLFARQNLKKLIIEKLPFFLVSLICGGFAFYTQNKTGAVAAFGVLTIQERVMYAAYGFVMYVVKFFAPLPQNLSTFYPYPYRYISGYLPSIYYAAPFIAVALLVVPVWLTKKKFPQFFRPVTFGLGYLFCNLVFVLQFISVGAAIMADRYSYVAYFGPMFLVPYLLYAFMQRFKNYRTSVIVVTSAFSLLLCVFCYQRTFAWHNAETLLTDAVTKYPYRALLSYKWLGHYYFDKGDYDKALENYEVLIKLRAADKKVEEKVAAINVLRDYQSASKIQPGAPMPNTVEPQGDFKPYADSAFYFCKTGDTLKAFRMYLAALRLNRAVEKVFSDSSFKSVQYQQFTTAIRQYDLLLKLYTSNPYYYFYRGVGKFSTGQLKPAIADWETAVKMDVKEVQQSASYNLSVAYDSIGEPQKAVYYLDMARKVGYTVNEEFANKLYRKAKRK